MRLLIPLLAAAVAFPPTLKGRELDHLYTHRKVVVLTLDAGGDAAGAWRILRTLQRKHVVATFFLTGRWANANPGLAKFIGKRYPVGNHTYHHLPMTHLSDSAAAREITTAAQAIRRVVDSLRPGEIILMHVGSAGDVDRSTIDANALPGVIDAVRRRGYSFTTFPARWRTAGRP